MNISDEFELLDPPGESVRVRFEGMLEGAPVVWHAVVMTLDAAASRRNFIEVGDRLAGGRRLTVALDVPIVDRPTIRKAVVMVRQWKRLAPGRHEFGSGRGPSRPLDR